MPHNRLHLIDQSNDFPPKILGFCVNQASLRVCIVYQIILDRVCIVMYNNTRCIMQYTKSARNVYRVPNSNKKILIINNM